MRKITVKEWYPESKLAEIYQDVDMKFAFLSSPMDGSRQCHTFVKCRDFLHDAVRAELLKGKCSIYQFEYISNENPPIDLHKTRMLVSMKNLQGESLANFENTVQHSLDLLHHYETLARAPLSKLYKTKSNSEHSIYTHIWAFISPVMWMKSPFLISMYTLLIRLGARNIKFDTNTELVQKYNELVQNNTDNVNDIQYLSSCYKYLKTVILNRRELFYGKKKNKFFDNAFFDVVNTNGFHDYCGIVSLSKNEIPAIIGEKYSKLRALEKTDSTPIDKKEKIDVPEQKKLLRVKGHTNDEGGLYTNNNVQFALMSTPQGNKRVQATGFRTCRDWLHEAVRACIFKNDGYAGINSPNCYTYEDDPPIDLNKLRLLILKRDANDKWKERLFIAKRIINHYEEMASWGETSKITTVHHEKYKKKVWLITGPKEWMHTPNLLSMVTLIIRAVTVSNDPIKYKTNEELIDFWKEGHFQNDNVYIRNSYEKFPTLMRRYSEIFTLPIEKAYPNEHDDRDFHGSGGIYNLCAYTSHNSVFNTNLQKICEENL